MKIYDEISDLTEFTPWSEAVHTYNKLIDADKAEEFIQQLDDVYPDGISETQLNDLLWFEEEWCYELVGLNKWGVAPLDGSDVINATNRICEAIENKIYAYRKEHNIECNCDFLSEWDFEESLDEWLAENQQDCTCEDDLAEQWLDDVGNDLIDEAISDELSE